MEGEKFPMEMRIEMQNNFAAAKKVCVNDNIVSHKISIYLEHMSEKNRERKINITDFQLCVSWIVIQVSNKGVQMYKVYQKMISPRTREVAKWNLKHHSISAH